MRAAGLALGLVACAAARSSPSSSPPVGLVAPEPAPQAAAPPEAAEPPVADAGVAITDVDAAPDPAPDAGAPPLTADACAPEDRAFCTLALRQADHLGDHVGGWGTVRLDGTARRYRFATLVPIGLGSGAYLIEQTPSVAWLLTFKYDGRTQPYGDGTGGPLAWTRRDDTAMDHSQTFHRGGEWFHFGVRGGQLVVLDYQHSDVELPEGDKQRTFARGLSSAHGTITGGRCATPCPRLAGFPLPEAGLFVEGPGATAALVGDD